MSVGVMVSLLAPFVGGQKGKRMIFFFSWMCRGFLLIDLLLCGCLCTVCAPSTHTAFSPAVLGKSNRHKSGVLFLSCSNMHSPFKILFLHGKAENGESFQRRLSSLEAALKGQAHFIFASSAPIPADLRPTTQPTILRSSVCSPQRRMK
jgi:hypothetical protein